MKTSFKNPSIASIKFKSNQMFVYLDNERIISVPLEKFPPIQNLSSKDKKAYEIIDARYLSFLSIDEVYSIEELIGLSKA
jgi:hypothetical protein